MAIAPKNILAFSHSSILALSTVLICIFFYACDKEEEFSIPEELFDLSAVPLEKLSDYNFFEGDIANLEAVNGVVLYELNTPLFSNYAAKKRFVYLPNGPATYNENDVFEFPVGSVIIKNFYFNNDIRDPQQGRKIIETRLLIHREDGWFPASYVWNEEQTDAEFNIVGKSLNLSWTHYGGEEKSIRYSVPNKNQCKGCHDVDKLLVPIGPKARNLNGMLTYPNGTTANQLEQWEKWNLLSGLPDINTVPKVPVWDDPSTGSLNDRARAYIDINCAHCHSIDGPANNSGLYMDYHREPSSNTGICKPPVAAGTGSGGRKFAIVPGSPEESILIYRLESLEPEISMPELSRSVVDEEGLELLRQWIVELDGKCGEG